MIIYTATNKEFQDDTDSGNIDEILQNNILERLRRKVSPSEIKSWQNSLRAVGGALRLSKLPHEVPVALEYTIPQTAKRVDFMLAGVDETGQSNLVIVELKQWTKVESTDQDGIVRTGLGGGLRETAHPSYQAWSYASLLNDFNEAVEEYDLNLYPCAFLHNCKDGTAILDPRYQSLIQKAPAFIKDQVGALGAYLKKLISTPGSRKIFDLLENGRIRPSKALIDHLSSMLRGHEAFVMIDEQKVVYEQALSLARRASETSKQVLIIEGGPGTGKSVLAINLLVELTGQEKFTQYVTKNAAPRNVFESVLSRSMTKSRISKLFVSSGQFHEAGSNQINALIVDEAHRLMAKSGIYRTQGENQIKEIINASQFTVFFIDEDQRVSLADIGSKAEIMRHARAAGAQIQHGELMSQFRCSGSDGYIAWLDHILRIRDTANTRLELGTFSFEVADSPEQLQTWVLEKNRQKNRARMVAGYCWDWKSKSSPAEYDIVLGNDFRYQWNLVSDGNLWILKEESIKQIGCIHTCQGLEIDWIGVIIGPDLIVRDGEVITRPEKRATHDSTIRGYKTILKSDPEGGKELVDRIIKNTYRTLMTRGIYGCMVYSEDEETREYFKWALSAEAKQMMEFPQGPDAAAEGSPAYE